MATATDSYWLQMAVNAAFLCCFYVPLALAFALVQAVSNRVFLSFGDFATFGAFAAVYAALARSAEGDASGSVLFLSLLAAFVSAAALGIVTAREIFAPLIGQSPLAFMIASVGLSIIIQEVLRLQSGARELWLPPLFDLTTVRINAVGASAQIGITQVIAAAVSLFSTIAIFIIERWTRFGRQWRACSQSQQLARLCGLDTLVVLSWTCVASAVLASLSGWIIAVAYGGVSFSLGLMAGFKAMFASVIGGFGTLRGAVVGALFLAVTETLWTALFPMAYRDAAIFAVIIMILVLRPEGLLGVGRRRESE